MSIKEALRPLRDVGGVLGSFVVDDRGALVGADVPELIAGDALEAVAARLAQVGDALSQAGALSDCALRFGEHTLFLHRFADRTLCVLAPQPTNLAALRMGSRLAARRLVSEPVVESNTAPAPAPEHNERGEAGAPPPPAKPPRPRFFRGRRIE